jgi:nucleotide-binding universal stress UspA family protein
MIKRILVPVDFSKPSLQALEYAIAFGEPFAADFLVLFALDPASFTPPVSPFGMEVDTGRVFEELQRSARDQLTRLEANLKRRGVSVRTLLQIGTPYQAIVAAAKKLRMDLIIMATHGRTGLSHVLLGSVAEKVVRSATCPVLTVHGYRRRPAASPRRRRSGPRRRRGVAA